MKPYIHRVQYYETDKMGITHHSNYIRFMEEARLDFFKQIGFDYLEFEKLGIISPVVGLNNIKFKKPTTVGDEIEIEVHIKAYTGVTLAIHYTMKKGDLLVLEGDSEHCFLSKEGRILVISEKNFPDFHAKMKSLLGEGAK